MDREVGAKSLHLGSVERGRRDRQSVLASTDQVAGAGCRLEFRDDFVAEAIARNAFEVGVVIGARTRHVDALERVDTLRRDLRDGTAHAVGAYRQRRAKLVYPGSILSANSQHGAVFDDQIGKPQALAKLDALETAGRVDHRGIHQGAAEAQSAIVGTVAREFAAVVEVGTKSAHPLEADAARALEHFEHAHSSEHLGAAAEHDMRRESVGREGVLVDQQNAALVAREQNRGSTARDACADNYRVKSFRLPGHERCTTSITLPGKERAPSFEGALPCCEAFQPRLIPAAILAALASPRGISPKVNSLSGYFFLVFLAGFFFAILLFRIGLDLVAFLARFFIPGIGTSSS